MVPCLPSGRAAESFLGCVIRGEMRLFMNLFFSMRYERDL